jgi:HK97 family phage portal protein
VGIFTRKTEERKAQVVDTYFKMIHAYSPTFRTFQGGVYEMELTRAAIHTFATHISKAVPIIKGSKYKNLEQILRTRPNDIMTTSQFLYKLATIYKAENNAFIIPIYEERNHGKVVGFYPVAGSSTEIVRVGPKLLLKYKIYPDNSAEQSFAIPYEEVGHLRSHYYRKELYGESNNALVPTMNLLSTQQQAIIQSVQQSATIRFMAKLTNILKPEDVKKEQERLRDMNLGIGNNGGVFMYDNKYADVKQVDSKPFTVDAEQTKLINESVYNYFGTNEAILQSRATESEWEAFYESQLEPFLIELSQVMTNMIFTYNESQSFLVWEASRLQYASAQTKLALITQLFDRGFITHNDGRTIFNMPPRDDGDKFYIRREYAEVNKLDDVTLIESGKEEENDNT